MDHVSREFCLRLPALAATPWVVLKMRAQEMRWRGAARVEAINLAEIVGEPDHNEERISDYRLAELFLAITLSPTSMESWVSAA